MLGGRLYPVLLKYTFTRCALRSIIKLLKNIIDWAKYQFIEGRGKNSLYLFNLFLIAVLINFTFSLIGPNWFFQRVAWATCSQRWSASSRSCTSSARCARPPTRSCCGRSARAAGRRAPHPRRRRPPPTPCTSSRSPTTTTTPGSDAASARPVIAATRTATPTPKAPLSPITLKLNLLLSVNHTN